MKMFRVSALLLAISLCFRLLMGCGGGNGSGGTTGLAGKVEGWAFVQGGVVKLQNGPTPPAGATALSGATVAVDGRTGTVATDGAGHFLVADVPIGQRRMHITPPAGAGAPVLDVPLTIVSSATVQTGAFTISRQQAIDLAKAALAGTAADYRIIAPQQPLPVGVVVSPALGNRSGQPDPTLDYTVASPQWFVYADPVAGERFQHPVSYVLVDAQTGAVTVRAVTSWPRINQVSQYADDDANAAAPDLVQVGTRMAAPEKAGGKAAEIRELVEAVRKTRDHVPGATDPKTYALFIQGNSRSDFEADMESMKANLFGPNGLSGPSDVRTWSPPDSGTVNAEAAVKQLFNQVCAQARAQDTLLIYITSHGSEDGVIFLQQGVESDESTTKDGYIFPYLDLDTSRCAACHVIFIIDACYAGQAMVKMDVNTPPHAGQKRTIIAASTSAETSGGITRRINLETGKPKGGVFTNAFLASLKDFSQANGGANQSNLTDIFNGAVTRMNSTRQHPQTVFRWDNTSCGAPPALIQVTPESVTAKHTVGVTSCPQDLGSISIKNLTDKPLSYSMSLNSSYFNLSGVGGTLSAGQTKSTGLSFNCGKVPPLTASISITATAGTSSQSASVPITLNAGP